MSYLDGIILAIISTMGFGATAVLAQSGMQYVKPASVTIISLIVGSATVNRNCSFNYNWTGGLAN